MNKIAVIAIASLTLTGCMTARMNDGLNTMLGKPISYAVGRLGYPDGQREMMGDTLYVWSTNHQAVLPVYNASSTTGTVGGTPFYGTTSSMGLMRAQAYCTIQIAVTPQGLIKTYQWNGNPIGCRGYASALNR